MVMNLMRQHFLNNTFPDEASIRDGKLDRWIIEQKRELANLDNAIRSNVQTASSSSARQDTVDALEATTNSIKGLAASLEVIRPLDNAKRNLTCVIRTLRNKHMLVSAIQMLDEQVRLHSHQRDYESVARLVRELDELTLLFRDYAHVESIATLMGLAATLKQELRAAVMVDVCGKLTAMSTFEAATTTSAADCARVRSMCDVLCAIHEQSARDELMQHISNDWVTQHDSITTQSEIQMDHCFRQIRMRLIPALKNTYAASLPNDWRVFDHVLASVISAIRHDIEAALMARTCPFHAVLNALHDTIAFDDVIKRDASGMGLADVFAPYLSPAYAEFERVRLDATLEYANEERGVERLLLA